jgi:hypothetical protein
VTDKPATLDDALYLIDAHKKTGCMFYAFDYANRLRGYDYDRMKRGLAYVITRLEAADKRRAE